MLCSERDYVPSRVFPRAVNLAGTQSFIQEDVHALVIIRSYKYRSPKFYSKIIDIDLV